MGSSDDQTIGELISEITDAGAEEETISKLLHTWSDEQLAYIDDHIREFSGNSPAKFTEGMNHSRFLARQFQIEFGFHLQCECAEEGVACPEQLNSGGWVCMDCNEVVLEEDNIMEVGGPTA